MTNHQKRISDALVDAAYEIVGGQYLSASVHLAEALLELVGGPAAKQAIDAAAARRANLVAVAAEDAKFGRDQEVKP